MSTKNLSAHDPMYQNSYCLFDVKMIDWEMGLSIFGRVFFNWTHVILGDATEEQLIEEQYKKLIRCFFPISIKESFNTCMSKIYN